MKNILILFLVLLVPLISSAQEALIEENPVFEEPQVQETPRPRKVAPARSKKRLFSAALTVENVLGMNPAVAAYYSLPTKPWNFGLKYRNISTTISDIKLSGSIIGVEAQRYLWHKSRLQLWGSAEVGMINTDMDLSFFSATESKVKKTETYFSLGTDLRYNLTNRLRLTGGASIFHDSLNKRFEGNNGSYKLETKPFHLGYRIGLLYFF